MSITFVMLINNMLNDLRRTQNFKDMDFKDIKKREVENYIKIIKLSADKAKCLKQLLMRSKSPKYQHELFDLFLLGEIPSASTITQMNKKIYSIVVSMSILFRSSRSFVSYDDMWNIYNELILVQNKFPFLDLDEVKDLVLSEILPF